MRDIDALAADLHARGLRVTPQRELIYSLLAERPNHPTVEAVHEAVVAGCSSPAREATIITASVGQVFINYSCFIQLFFVCSIHSVSAATADSRVAFEA